MSKDSISLIIAIVLAVVSVVMELFTNTVLDLKHYIGFTGIAVSLFLFFKRKDLYVYSFLATLVLGFIGIVDVFYISINFGVWIFKINPIFALLLVLFFGTNREIMDKMFPEKEKK